jgi:stearoyl-CoA desaturase (delta-9 desaturase)
VVEKAAGQLAESFRVDQINAELRARLAERRAGLNASFDELHDRLALLIDSWSQRSEERLESARRELDEFIRGTSLPAMPTVADLRARASAMFVGTPSMNDIVERARQKLIDAVFDELLGRKAETALSGA